MDEARLLNLLKFVLDRFCGQVPDEKMLINAVEDFNKENV